MATALVTGAGGLIGSWLLKHWDIPGLEAVPIRRLDVDLLLPGSPTTLVQKTAPSHVVHLAWCASGDLGYRDSNDNFPWIDASLELYRACRAAGAHFWATGSVVDGAAHPGDWYTAAKAELRGRLNADIRSGGIGWLRPYHVFDPNARRPALVARALDARDRGEPVRLRTPDAAHDFVHASDVATAILAALRRDLTGEIQIGSGIVRSVIDLVAALGADWRTEDSGPPRAQSHVEPPADLSRLADIGWTPIATQEFFRHG